VRYKFHEHRYTFKGNFSYAADCIRHSLDMMGHEEDNESPELHVYNHTCRDLEPDMPENSIIFKPTAPTSKHFQICREGYANSSEITFEEPVEYEYRKYDNIEWNEINDLIERRANKWDDSIMLKWPDAKNVKKDHILIIGQMPEDETVMGFGFGDHWKKMCMIIDKLEDRDNLVIKLHPRIRKASHRIKDINKYIEEWKGKGHQVFSNYESIHSILPYTKVAITENSTAGIECMMHDVPIISYGYPDYHWITNDLRILTKLRNSVDDLTWFNKEKSRRFLCWYVFDYLCYDIPTTMRRLEEIL
jgi:hypothetical protein